MNTISLTPLLRTRPDGTIEPQSAYADSRDIRVHLRSIDEEILNGLSDEFSSVAFKNLTSGPGLGSHGGVLFVKDSELYVETANGLVQLTSGGSVNHAGLDHGSLSGLSDDDHPQYLNRTKDAIITGSWTFNTEPTLSRGLFCNGKIQSTNSSLSIAVDHALELVGDPAHDYYLFIGKNYGGIKYETVGGIPPATGYYYIKASGPSLNISTTFRDSNLNGVRPYVNIGSGGNPMDLYVSGSVYQSGSVLHQSSEPTNVSAAFNPGCVIYSKVVNNVPEFMFSNSAGHHVQITENGKVRVEAHTHAASDITSGTFADSLIAESNVTQHQAALSINETQIVDGTVLARLASNETVTGMWNFQNRLTLVDPSTTTRTVDFEFYNGDLYVEDYNATTGLNNLIFYNKSDKSILTLDYQNARVGIGNLMAPSYTLHVNGDAMFSGNVGIGNSGASPSSTASVFIKDISSYVDNGLYVQYSNYTSSGVKAGLYNYTTARPNGNGGFTYGIYNRVIWYPSAISNQPVMGMRSVVEPATWATVHDNTGNIYGIHLAMYNRKPVRLANVTGIYVYVKTEDANAEITNAYGIRLDASNMSGTISSYFGLMVKDTAVASNYHSIYIEPHTGNDANHGNIYMVGGGWNDGHIRMENSHIWTDKTNDCVRIKGSTPTAETDGLGLTYTYSSDATTGGQAVLGKIGGGPSTSNQAGWLAFYIGGTLAWVPYWT